jgi:hypothetical protein
MPALASVAMLVCCTLLIGTSLLASIESRAILPDLSSSVMVEAPILMLSPTLISKTSKVFPFVTRLDTARAAQLTFY